MRCMFLLPLIFFASALPVDAAGRCAGICEYCAVKSERGCARCSVNEQCLKTLKSPKQKYKRVPLPKLQTKPN